jgi:hypothetical protein
MKFSKLNRNLAQRVWDIAGITIIQLLAAFSEKLTSVQHTAKQYHEGKGTPCIHHDEEDSTSRPSVSQEVINKMVDKKGIVDLSCIFEKEELDLVKSLLELILCISLCSCKDFQDLTPKKQNSLHHITKQGRGTRSDTSMGRPPLPKKLTMPSSAHQHRSPSPLKGVRQSSCWVKENPHLTTTLDRFVEIRKRVFSNVI